MMNREQIKKLAYTGMFAALIFLAVYVVRIPIGLNGSYIHVGDAFVYLAACVLPLPYAMAASAIGAGLSDALAPGGLVWLPATMLIKSLCCVAFSRRQTALLNRRNITAVFVGAGITLVGYSLAGAVLFGSWVVALAEVPISLVQAAASGVLFVALAKMLDKVLKGKALV